MVNVFVPLLLAKKRIDFSHGQHTACDNPLLNHLQIALFQQTTILHLFRHESLQLSSHRLRTIGIRIVRKEVVVIAPQYHLTRQHPRALLDIRINLRIDQYRAHQYPILSHTRHNQKFLMVYLGPRSQKHRTGNYREASQTLKGRKRVFACHLTKPISLKQLPVVHTRLHTPIPRCPDQPHEQCCPSLWQSHELSNARQHRAISP